MSDDRARVLAVGGPADGKWFDWRAYGSSFKFMVRPPDTPEWLWHEMGGVSSNEGVNHVYLLRQLHDGSGYTYLYVHETLELYEAVKMLCHVYAERAPEHREQDRKAVLGAIDRILDQ